MTYDNGVKKSTSYNRLQNSPGTSPGISVQTSKEEKNMSDNKNNIISREDQIARIYENAPVFDIFARFTPEYKRTFENQMNGKPSGSESMMQPGMYSLKSQKKS